MGYLVIDNDNELVSEVPFPSERKAYEAKRVYEDHCDSLARPLRVVRADTMTNYGQCSVCRRDQLGKRHEHPCE
jgi:hypothetical protein